MGTKSSDQKSFTNLFPQISDDNSINILDIWNSFRIKVLPKIYEDAAYFEYRPKSSDTLYGIADSFYGDVKLWWLIPLINDAEDPFDFLKDTIDSNKSIILVKPQYISNIIFTLTRLKNNSDK